MNDMTLYNKYRDQMKTGDLLTYDTDGIISSMIKWWSPEANHAGMVLDLDEYEGEEHRRWTLEATSGGPRMAFLSGLLKTEYGRVWWHPLKPEFDDARTAIGCFALEQQGVVKYDFISLLKYPFKTVSADLNKLFCSEYVFLSWKAGGIVAGDAAPKPSDLAKFGATLPPVLIIDTKPEDLPVTPTVEP